MKASIVALFLLTVIAALAEPSRDFLRTEEIVKAEQPEEIPDAGIKGGRPANEGEFPYFVDWGGCGGSLIHEDIILTAAHCNGIDTTDVYVNALRSGSEEHDAEKIGIDDERSIIHPDYDADSFRFDVMVLKLMNPSSKSPITVNKDPNQPIHPAILTTMGHGRIEGGLRTEDLMTVDLPKISDNLCEDWYPADNVPSFDPEIMLCAGYKEGGKASCKGDSGGPIVQNRYGSEILVGVTSWGGSEDGDGEKLCGYKELPGVYVKASAVADWIDEQICRLSNNPPSTCPIVRVTIRGNVTVRDAVVDKSTRRVKVMIESKTDKGLVIPSIRTDSQGQYEFVENLMIGQEYFVSMEAPKDLTFGGYGNDDVDDYGKSDTFVVTETTRSIQIDARLQNEAKFYGQLSFESNLAFKKFKEGRAKVKVTLMLVYTRSGKKRYKRIKTSFVNQKGNTGDVGKWNIPLKIIRKGSYYLKFTTDRNVFGFAKVDNDSFDEKNGKTARLSVAYGGRYETNVTLQYKTGNFDPPPLPPLNDSIRINVGGPEFVDKRGNIWKSYKKASIYSSGLKYSISNSTVISDTAMQDLYRSELYFVQAEADSPPMALEVPLPPGDYRIRLHFAEIWHRAQREGARVFNVLIENELVWKNLDIYKEAGGANRPLVKESLVTMVDSTEQDALLTVEFQAVEENPKLSAIEILLGGQPPCTSLTVDFDTKPDGTPLEAGLYVEDEWLDFGLLVSAPGGFKGLPRLFDTANPRAKPGCGDSDLGAPNRDCGGPGVGVGGAPGKPGENCDPLGNVLIIQEDNDDTECPDDSRNGGTILFEFVEPALEVYEMGFLDTDDLVTIEVSHMIDNDVVTSVFELPIYGDNSKQALDINIENVTQIMVTFEKSGAVTHISFCSSAEAAVQASMTETDEHVAIERSIRVP